MQISLVTVCLVGIKCSKYDSMPDYFTLVAFMMQNMLHSNER